MALGRRGCWMSQTALEMESQEGFKEDSELSS